MIVIGRMTNLGRRIRPLSKPCIALGAAVAMSFGGMGCQKSLFSDKDPRTQYEQYDRVHGGYVPPTVTDQNGRKRPALRERLKPPQG